jgi:predicted secreted Zn-dependent protease
MTVTMHDVHWTHHDVPGHTLADVAAHIGQMVEAGQTHWHPTFHATRWEGQTIAEAHVDVAITVTMPNWSGSSSASAEEQAEWERFLGALHAHEQGHLDLAQTYLANADTLLEGFDEHTAATQWQNNLHALQTASDQYDAGNHHGEDEGTIINVP